MMEDLKLHANNIRKNIVKMVTNAKSGHPGGSLSAADILTVLYFEFMDINREKANSIDRDRFVLSKGHASPALYAVLKEKGIIDDDLLSFRVLGSRLQGHPDMKRVEGVDMSTGSLGQGISAAVGMAIANKLDNNEHRIYAMLGDGECQEGEVWEASMAAAHYKLDNLCAILDFNGLQIDGDIRDVMSPLPFDEKFKAFGWHVIEIDGHNFDEIRNALNEAKTVKGKPTMIIAHTVKGKGVSYMENAANWHGVAPNAEQCEIALKDLEVIK